METLLTQEQLTQLGLADLDPDERLEILTDLEATIFTDALERLAQDLPKKEAELLQETVEESESVQAIVDYLTVGYPEFPAMLQQSIDAYVATAADVAQEDTST